MASPLSSKDEYNVSRQSILNEFYRLLSYRQQKNVLRIVGPGGYGKTWVLEKIRSENELNHRFVSEVIDFHKLENQSIPGLRDSIVAQLAKIGGSFSRYEKAHANYDLLKETEQESTKLIAAELDLDYEFFQDVRDALADREIVLLFDTFEKAQDKAVGGWFLEEFLPRAKGAIIVIAGREFDANQRPFLSPPFPYQVVTVKVKEFSMSEIIDHCGKLSKRFRQSELTSNEIDRLASFSGGVPLKHELFFQNKEGLIRSILDPDFTQAQFDDELIQPFLEKIPFNELLWCMVYLRRRFNYEILERLIGAKILRGLTIAEARTFLLESGWVKLLQPQTDNYALHDIFCEMLGEKLRAFGPANEIASRAYEEIVKKWYNAKINHSDTNVDERRLLMAEQIGYSVERAWLAQESTRDSKDLNDSDGGQMYFQRFQDAQAKNDFHLAELLFSEVFLYISKFKEGGYILCRTHADWLYKTGQLINASNLFRYMAHLYESPRRRALSLQRLGDILQLRGRKFDPAYLPEPSRAQHLKERAYKLDYLRLNNAFDVALKGAQEAAQGGETEYEAIFLHRQGLIIYPMGRWIWAKELYEEAMSKIKATENTLSARGSYSQIKLSLGELEARLGDYDEADRKLKSVWNIRRELKAEDLTRSTNEQIRATKLRFATERIVDALLHWGRIMRYMGKPYTAEDKYKLAFKEIENELGGKPEEQVNVSLACALWQDRGSNWSAIGYRKRTEAEDLSESVTAQFKGASAIIKSVEIARSHRLKQNLPHAFRRLGRVFEELSVLERIVDEKTVSEEALIDMERLQHICYQFSLNEEKPWRRLQRLTDLTDFKDLNTLGKAQRLYEVGFLESDAMDDYHYCWDGIQDAAHIARLRGRDSDLEYYARLVSFLRGFDFQEELFEAMIKLTQADILFSRKQYYEALEGYAINFPILCDKGGYGALQWKRRMDELETDLRKASLSKTEKRNWCKNLRGRWESQRNSSNNAITIKGLSELIARLRSIEDDL